MKFHFIIYRAAIVLLFCCTATMASFAQRTCGTVFDVQRYNTDSAFRNAVNRKERLINNTIATQKLSGRTLAAVKKIPVVFHVLYNNGYSDPTNISVEQIYDQINILNRDFRLQNPDVLNTPGAFSSFVADVEFEFCLATVDPQGNPTGGITRTLTDSTEFFTEAMKFSSSGGKDIWNRDNYLNIWIVPKISGPDDYNGLGFSTFPGDPANVDGVVIGYKYLGSIGTATTPYNLGRTATHEIGHWFNLIHIWGDEGGCAGSDAVGDTPNQASQNYGCHAFPKLDACQTSGNGVMYMNYMDYTNDNCMYMFTSGQKDRMRASMQLYRSNFWNETIIACNSCSLFANYSNSIFGGDYIFRSLTSISSTQLISAITGSVKHQATNAVIWSPGFRAQPLGNNARVEAIIKACNIY